MVVGNKVSTSWPNKFQGIEPVYVLQILGTSVKKSGKLLSCSGDTKKLNLGDWEQDKGRFKVLSFTKTNIPFTLPPSLQHADIKFLTVRKSSEFKITGVYGKSSAEKNCHTAIYEMMKKLYSLFLILAPIKNVHAFQIFMSVSITFVAINHEEMLKKDLASNIF